MKAQFAIAVIVFFIAMEACSANNDQPETDQLSWEEYKVRDIFIHNI